MAIFAFSYTSTLKIKKSENVIFVPISIELFFVQITTFQIFDPFFPNKIGLKFFHV